MRSFATRRSAKFPALAILLLGLTGCALTPLETTPKPDSPTAWRVEAATAEQAADLAWWEGFQDPVLTDLVRAALADGLDLRIAAARVEQAAAVLAQSRAGLLPQVGYGAGLSREEPGRNLSGELPLQSAYQLGINASWEADVFGRLRRANEAARARLLASEEGRQATLLALVANVASTYIQLRDLDRRLEIASTTAETQSKSLRIFNLQHQAGVISLLQLSQAQSQFEQARAAIPDLERAIAQTENALSVLLGRHPGPIPRGKSLDGLAPPPIPAGLPSDLLTRRPDLRQAEHQLRAAQADLAAARTRYYPTISLTGALGLLSTAASDLFSGPARMWSFAGAVSGPIFTGGAVAGQVVQADAARQELLLRYQQAVSGAFADVNDALVEVQKRREQRDARMRQVEALRSYARLARHSYEAGNSPYLEVLNAEQTLFGSELQLAQTQGEALLAVVRTYAAMGGGWVAEADKLTGTKPVLGTTAP